MATSLFHFPSSGAPSVSPAFYGPWTDVSQADRVFMPLKRQEIVNTPLTDKVINVPITTTQTILIRQYVSNPIPPQLMISSGTTLTGPVRLVQSAAGVNATLKWVIHVIGPNTDSDWFDSTSGSAIDAVTPTTRNLNNTINTWANTVIQAGSRLQVEIGVSVAAPTVSGTVTARFGNPAGVADFANNATSTTDLCPWIALSYDIFSQLPNNYRFVHAGDGMSVSEGIR